MALTKVIDLITQVAITLQDRTNVRWPKVDLLKYFNDAQRQIVLYRPDARAKNTAFDCAASSKQSLPADALRLLTVKRNVDGRAITPMERDILDVQLPDWHQQQATVGVEHYIYDPLDPKTFYVFPVPVANHPIEIVYSTAPGDVEIADYDTDSTVISLDDIYANTIMDWMLYRAYLKDADYGDANRASLYLQSFGNALGVKTQVDSALAGSTSRQAA